MTRKVSPAHIVPSVLVRTPCPCAAPFCDAAKAHLRCQLKRKCGRAASVPQDSWAAGAHQKRPVIYPVVRAVEHVDTGVVRLVHDEAMEAAQQSDQTGKTGIPLSSTEEHQA